MKVVFLDFDGVLNHVDYMLGQSRDGPKPLSLDWWAAGLDPTRVELVNELLDRTGAKVVVSSSWRVSRDVRWLQAVLEKAGFTGEVIDKTARCYGVARWEEIAGWITAHHALHTRDPIEAFVIFDDDHDAEIAGHFIRTDATTGLTSADVEVAVQVLAGKLYRPRDIVLP